MVQASLWKVTEYAASQNSVKPVQLKVKMYPTAVSKLKMYDLGDFCALEPVKQLDVELKEAMWRNQLLHICIETRRLVRNVLSNTPLT